MNQQEESKGQVEETKQVASANEINEDSVQATGLEVNSDDDAKADRQDIPEPNNRRMESEEGGESEQKEIEDFSNQQNVLKSSDYGCKHYLCASQQQCSNPICVGAFYTCRLCHDEIWLENELDPKKNHQFDRFQVTHVKCLRC